MADTMRLRVLCFHGFRTSASILEQQVKLAKWDPSLHSLLDLHFLDGPFPAQGESNVEGKFPPPFFEWYRTNKDFTEYYGVEECVTYVADFMKLHGPFDGILGFSQGAFLAGALAGLQEKGMALTDVPRMRFVVLVSGGRLRYKEVAVAYADPIITPSLHLIGEQDFLNESGKQLAKYFHNPGIIEHPYGHLVPRLKEDLIDFFKDFIKSILKKKEEEKQRQGE